MSLLVSVCIPTYNRSNSLKRAIENILSQTYNEIEILISDNFSTDETSRLCESLAKEDSRIRYFRQLSNIGPTANFEFVRKKAKGEYFIWLSDDDYLENDYIEKCVSELEKSEDLILVSGLCGFKKNGSDKINHFGNIIKLDSSYRLLRIFSYLYDVMDNSIFYGIYRTKKIDKFIMPNVLAGDWIWLVQILSKGKAKVLTNTRIIRSYGDSTSSSYESIVNVILAPKWNAKFPNIAIISNFFNFFLKKNILLLTISCFTLLLKFLRSVFVFYIRLSQARFYWVHGISAGLGYLMGYL